MEFRKIADWLDAQAEEMVALQAELTAIPALNPEGGGKGEWDKSNMLESWLKERGLSPAEHYDTPDDRVPEGTRPNFVVRVRGRNKGRRVWVMTHLDVVPPGERREDGTWAGWDSDPFTLRREGDRIFGRGVEDNQQALVASAFAALALKELGITPPHEVALLIVSAEETGSAYGFQRLLKDHPELFSPDDIIIVPDGGNENGSMIEVAEKSVLWLTFEVIGKQSHGSMPHLGRNAFRAVAQLICALDRGLRKRFDVHDDLYSPPYSTFEPTKHDKNVPNVNTIPAKEIFSFDCRIMPRFKLDDVLDYIRAEMARVDKKNGTQTSLTVENRLDAPEQTATDAPVVQMVQRAVKAVYGVEGRPMGIGGSTVAAFFRQAGYPAVVWSSSEGKAHQANESMPIAHMVGDAKVFAHVFTQESVRPK